MLPKKREQNVRNMIRAEAECVYIDTVQGLTQRRDATAKHTDRADSSSRRKKIIVIKKSRRADGSISSTRQEIYKDYGVDHARR